MLVPTEQAPDLGAEHPFGDPAALAFELQEVVLVLETPASVAREVDDPGVLLNDIFKRVETDGFFQDATLHFLQLLPQHLELFFDAELLPHAEGASEALRLDEGVAEAVG